MKKMRCLTAKARTSASL